MPAHAVDIAIAGQAFHWFDHAKARAEFMRVLKPEGFAVLVWNVRRTESTQFLRDYEQLVTTFGTDYQEINHVNSQTKSVLAPFFGGDYFTARFDNVQRFDLAGLMGRIHSSSYMPAREHANYAPMAKRAMEIFALHQQNNKVAFEYDTVIYYGLML